MGHTVHKHTCTACYMHSVLHRDINNFKVLTSHLSLHRHGGADTPIQILWKKTGNPRKGKGGGRSSSSGNSFLLNFPGGIAFLGTIITLSSVWFTSTTTQSHIP